MRKFAEIDVVTQKVITFFDWELDVDPVFDPEIRIAVDVTELDPLPEIGSTL